MTENEFEDIEKALEGEDDLEVDIDEEDMEKEEKSNE
jgi:hypothetical protein